MALTKMPAIGFISRLRIDPEIGILISDKQRSQASIDRPTQGGSFPTRERNRLFYLDDRMDFPSFAQIVTTVGIPGALTIFFVWQGNIRETRMAARIDTLEDFIRTEQSEQLSIVAEALKKNTDSLDRANETMSRLAKKLEGV